MRLVKHRHFYIYTTIYLFIKKIQDIFLNTMGVQNSNKINFKTWKNKKWYYILEPCGSNNQYIYVSTVNG